MRKIFWLGAAIAMLGAAACGSDESSPANTGTGGADAGLGGTGGSGFDGGLGGSGGTSTGGTGGTGATGGSGGTGGTGSGDCTGVFTGECGTCLESFCCTELAACNDTAGCVGCIQGDSTLCDADNQATAEAVITCAQTDCQVECFGAPVVLDPACDAPATAATQGSCVTLDSTITCNPVTNEPCDTAGGEACDADSNGGFSCFPAPNTESLCAACDATNGPWCKGTSTCVGTASGAGCARYCCDDTDCVPGTCDKDTLGMAGGVGVCVVGSGGTGGAGGAGGAGGDGGAAGASTGGAAGASTGGAAGASTGGAAGASTGGSGGS